MGNDSRKKCRESEFRIEEVNVRVPWGFLASKCWGDSQAKPVLVVHGIQDNAGSFDRLLPLLPRGFYYVCLELPGHGKSSPIPSGMDLNAMQYINAIYRFVKHFNWSRFYFLGHSLGGQLGVYFAAMYPEQVIKLVVLDTLPYFSYKLEEFLEHYKSMNEKLMKMEIKMAKSLPPSYTYEEAIERLMSQRVSPINREAAEALAKRMLKRGEKGFHFSTDQRLKFGVRVPMPAEQNLYNISLVKCPCLLILTKVTHKSFGEGALEDMLMPILRTLEKMKNVHIVYVDGYHDVHNVEPDVVAPYIVKFLIHEKSAL